MLLLLVAACGSLLPAPTVPPGARPPARVLLVVMRMTGRVESALAAMRAQRRADGSPAVIPEVMMVKDRRDARERVAALGARAMAYDAVYVPSIMVARSVQMVLTQVPIIFEGVDDPVARCLVDRPDHPGRNATGYTHWLADDDFKAVQTLHQAWPGLQQVRMLVDHENLQDFGCTLDDPFWHLQAQEPCTPGPREADAYVERRLPAARMAAYARSLGLTLRFDVVCSTEGLADTMRLAQADAAGQRMAWLVPYQDRFIDFTAETVAAVNATGQPAIYPNLRFIQAGGLMALATVSPTGEASPVMPTLLQVLQGQSPAGLPVQEPRGFELTINLRVAQALDQRPALGVLRAADHLLH